MIRVRSCVERGGEQGGFLPRVACQVLPLKRLGQGARASNAPVDKFRDWGETHTQSSGQQKALGQQMEVWFSLGTTAERPTHAARNQKDLHPRSSEARRESFCPLDKESNSQSTNFVYLRHVL
jgi:hypothetical protein